jgi:hypothetical protein
MIIAASDINIDLFAKRHPVCVLTFVLSWTVPYEGLQALVLPIAPANQVHWIPTLPFVYLLLRFQAVLQMESEHDGTRFSDLFAYSLSLDVGASGVFLVYLASPNSSRWFYLPGVFQLFCGVALFQLYCQFCCKHSRRLALSFSLYGYLLAYGFGDLGYNVVNQYALNKPPPLIDYSFAIIHIFFPLIYFAFRPLINRVLGRHWLEQRRDATEFELTPALEMRGNLADVETAITAKVDLNAFVFSTKEDELTLLHLAVLNEHYDSVQRLLQTGEVQANKPSGSKGRTAIFLAAELGQLPAVVLLLEQAADLNTLADDGQSPLIVATANGHTEVAALLREYGANEHHKWMGLDGMCFRM